MQSANQCVYTFFLNEPANRHNAQLRAVRRRVGSSFPTVDIHSAADHSIAVIVLLRRDCSIQLTMPITNASNKGCALKFSAQQSSALKNIVCMSGEAESNP